ncbi:BgtA-20500 [Blumeria graminis f. sp. tritici]|uniref:BgtA-20500 n=2 Tax=Blumeria graminis f. sp. tritici TaxID=62690 RepID=A0A9X9QFH4_BLUGR|nr:hypothetical protein BGT96224_A20500 [Blumeria graminis f. sp. tritici 96224]VDB92977.1 BgtA-20500 [Blumeria graminis f. sp. tritici]
MSKESIQMPIRLRSSFLAVFGLSIFIAASSLDDQAFGHVSQTIEYVFLKNYFRLFWITYINYLGSTNTKYSLIASAKIKFQDPYDTQVIERTHKPRFKADETTIEATVNKIYSQYLWHFENTLTTATKQSPSGSFISAIPTLCTEKANFVLKFDDIPPLAIGNHSADDVQPMPVFNPYHRFIFSNGFTVVPPPSDPYLPSSRPLLLEFIPRFDLTNKSSTVTFTTPEDVISGDIRSGDHGRTGCFRFNTHGAFFGCDSKGPDCDFSFTGFRFNRESQESIEVVSQRRSITACPSLINCELLPIELGDAFEDLDTLRINVTVAGQPKIWWMDDLSLSWKNDTCAAGLCRLRTRIH